MENTARYDIGLTGYWWSTNYGSVATYYALYRIIEDMGFSVILIDRPENDKHSDNSNTFSRNFMRERLNISRSLNWNELDKLNGLCNIFMIGSDQVWAPGAIKLYNYFFFLDFIKEHKKIAYAVSFGEHFNVPEEQRRIAQNCVKQFYKVSVRERKAVDICLEKFDIKADWVMDPVFLLDRSEWEELAQQSKRTEKDILGAETDFILSYILEPSEEKRNILIEVSKFLGLPLINILSGKTHSFEKNNEILNLPHTIENVEEEEWLYFFKKSKYIITDSHHGSVFSIIFNKQFICCSDKQWGKSRYESLFGLLDIRDRWCITLDNILQKNVLQKEINYEKVEIILKEKIAYSKKWLTDALHDNHVNLNTSIPISNDMKLDIEHLHSNNDFIKIRIIATLLRDYGIKHIVISPGGRDVPIVRIFEYNDNTFKLHRITDERSAAYFGMGMAAHLGEPVACVCTSGTAASNYLPAVTEAYYTEIPIIVITADRKKEYHEQGEDQTIPQEHIYDGVVKKSVTITECSGSRAEYQTKREISECILESMHNRKGPVHINIAIEDINIGSKAPRSSWNLLPPMKPHILRTGVIDGDNKLIPWRDALQKSKRILIVYGQNPPPTEEQLKYINIFSQKYNCIIVTDSISNLHSKYTLEPYNMLRALSQDEFNKALSPDILISVGGKRLMNDPLTFKIRKGLSTIRHWSVSPDGRVRDFYFRLTSIIEISQDFFFKWFSDNAGDIYNNNEYFNKWKSYTEKYPSPEVDRFNSQYIQSNFLPAIPDNSLLNLGVGETHITCRKYKIKDSVNVYCNMGTNGIDGNTSTFMGQCAVSKYKLCFLLVGDLSFFYDLNSIWNKDLKNNMRILMVNNNGTGLLRGHHLKGISSVHNTSAKGWVESVGFKYISASSKEEFNEKLLYFIDENINAPLFFEVFCE